MKHEGIINIRNGRIDWCERSPTCILTIAVGFLQKEEKGKKEKEKEKKNDKYQNPDVIDLHIRGQVVVCTDTYCGREEGWGREGSRRPASHFSHDRSGAPDGLGSDRLLVRFNSARILWGIETNEESSGPKTPHIAASTPCRCWGIKNNNWEATQRYHPATVQRESHVIKDKKSHSTCSSFLVWRMNVIS